MSGAADDDRAELAARLQDGVADRLAALATRLDAVMVRAASPQVQRVLGQAAAELADIAGGVRAIIVDLQRGDEDPDSVVGTIRRLALTAGQQLGCTPRIGLDGPLDGFDPGLAADLVRVVEEALANVVRHSYAGTVEVAVTMGGGRRVVEVSEDGVGPNEDPAGGTGLPDLRARADARGGEFAVEPNDPLGTRLRWDVPS
jgi:signal transduction histidine kinase